MVRVNILDEDTQHTIGMFGVGNADAIPRAEAFCDTVVRTGRPLRVEDATADPELSQLPSVVAGEIGAYLGIPLRGRESFIVGAVCVVDPNHREIDDDLQTRLVDFDTLIEHQLALIRRLQDQRIEGDLANALTYMHRGISAVEAGVGPDHPRIAALLSNYAEIFTDPAMRTVLMNTVAWVVLTPLIATAIGLVYAVLVDKIKFEGVAKTLLFLPMAISLVGASIIWKFMYDFKDPSQSDYQLGLLNQILSILSGLNV